MMLSAASVYVCQHAPFVRTGTLTRHVNVLFQAETASAGQTPALTVNMPYATDNDIHTVSTTRINTDSTPEDDAALGSPGPSVAPPSPDMVARASEKGWRGIEWGPADRGAHSGTSEWDEPEWQVASPRKMPSPNKAYAQKLRRMESGGRDQHAHQS